VAIARALAMEPVVLLLDEPTSALDPRLVGEVLAVVADLAAAGQTMVIVTHEIGFARRVADRVVVLAGGRIVESGPPEEVLERPRAAETRALLGADRRGGLKARQRPGYGSASPGFAEEGRHARDMLGPGGRRLARRAGLQRMRTQRTRALEQRPRYRAR